MKNIDITFNGVTADEAAALIAVTRPHPAVTAETVASSATSSSPVEAVVDGAIERMAEDVKAKKRGRKAKEAQGPVAPVVDATPPSHDLPLDTPQAFIDDVRNALSDLLAAKGMTECSQLLATFGATRISDLPTDKYAAVVAACREKQA